MVTIRQKLALDKIGLHQFGEEIVNDEFPQREISSASYKRNDSGVYIIRCAGFYKIGQTSNLEHRLQAYRSTNPLPIEIVMFLGTDFPKQMEKSIHELMHHKRAFGEKREWFNLTEGDMIEIVSYLESSWKILLSQQKSK